MTLWLEYQGGAFNGPVALPASKSISNRALIIQALSRGKIDLQGLSDSGDTKVLREVLANKEQNLDVGDAGTAFRFLTAYFAVQEGEYRVLTGTKRMKERPIGSLVDALRSLGSDIQYLEEEGYPPLAITGKRLEGGVVSISGRVSSQFISALLLIGPVLEKGLTLEVQGKPISEPYIEMTFNILKHFGAKPEREGNILEVFPGGYSGNSLTIEKDWSAASYWYEIGLLSGNSELLLSELMLDSWQGDRRIADYFHKLGVESEENEAGVLIRANGSAPSLLELDLTGEPDLAPALAAACAGKGIPFSLNGLQTLKVKESDRLQALSAELSKTGVEVREIDQERLTGDGTSPSSNAPVIFDTYEDHRLAMAFAPLAIVLEKVGIQNPSVVEKSYPGFWEELGKTGGLKLDGEP